MKRRPASAAAEAARSILAREGIEIRVVDEHRWQVGDFLFWPATGYWRRTVGSGSGNGARKLVAAVKADRQSA